MPSPFPGMDPWLERPVVFPSLHGRLIHSIGAVLNAALPPGYVATTDTRVYVDPELNRVPDVSVYGGPVADPAGAAGAVATLTKAGLYDVAAAPTSDPVEEVFLEILSGDDDRLVTAVEVISPTNKWPGPGRTSYRQKQDEYRAAGVNLVEIDLLRGGPHTTAAAAAELQAAAGPFDYHVCVTVGAVPGRSFVAPIRLTDPLPAIPIPLDPGVPPVLVGLQPVFDRSYDEGGFAKLAKYGRRAPDPPLTPDQRAWAEGVLRAKGV
ncbi:MAG: DUF4058 family protein [Gemmataceae bacterium]